MRLTLVLLLVVSLWLVALPVGAQSPCASGITHVVATGENLFRIGLAYGFTADQMAAANGITNVNSVQIGQVLCVPAAGTVFGTGGPTTQTTTTDSNQVIYGNNGRILGGPNTEIVGGRISINDGYYFIDRSANSVEITVPEGTLDAASGFVTTATVGLDLINNVLRVRSQGHIPNSQVRIIVSDNLGLLGSTAGYLFANELGVVDGYVYMPWLSQRTHQYVMIRSYDGRLTFGYFDMPRARFP